MIIDSGSDSLLFFTDGNKSMVLSPDTSLRVGGAQFESSAILELNSSNKGVVIPRLTTAQRDAISTKIESMLIYNSDNSQFEVYDGISAWEPIYQLSNFPIVSTLSDKDLDTRIETEATTDEDTIRMYVKGVEVWAFSKEKIHLPGANSNIFMGHKSGRSNTSGIQNVAVGSNVLKDNTTGNANVGIGSYALYKSNSGAFNTAVGVSACLNCTVAIDNTMLGARALRDNVSGSQSVAIGMGALQHHNNSFNNGGVAWNENNVAVGYYALADLYATATTNGMENTAVGYLAGDQIGTGYKNTFIGANTRCGGGGHIFNATAIGANTQVNQSNTVILGNNANVGIGTSGPTAKLQVGTNGDGTFAIANAWNTFSDQRLKERVTIIKNSTDILNQLGGYYYYWKDGKDTSRQVGVIAQEIETVLPELVFSNANGYKSVDYSKLSCLLIEVAKEQQKQIQETQVRYNSIEKRLKKLEEENLKTAN